MRRPMFRALMAAGVVGCTIQAPVVVAAKDGGVDAKPAAVRCGSGEECNRLGEKHRNGDGVPSDKAKAVEYFDVGCTLGNTDACENMAPLLFTGLSLPRDERRGLAAYQRACDLGVLGACRSVARMYERGGYGKGAVIPKDPARAAAILEKACTAGEEDSCAMLAQYYDKGTGVKKDKKKAAHWRRIAKEKGFIEGE